MRTGREESVISTICRICRKKQFATISDGGRHRNVRRKNEIKDDL